MSSSKKTHRPWFPSQVVSGCVLSFAALFFLPAFADEWEELPDLDGPELAGEEENASNPLAAVNNTDLRLQYLDLPSDGGHQNDYFIDGAYMLQPKLKLKYELHYWDTNASGSSQNDWESVHLKLIYFPAQGIFTGGTKYRWAVGLEYIHDLGDLEKGIGFGANQIGPFGGIALAYDSGLTLVPLLQHYTSISGVDVNITAARLIAIQPLMPGWWLKADAKVPYNWENSTVSAEGEIQLGRNINSGTAVYVDGLIGFGGHRAFDWGIGIGLRFNY